MLLSGPSLYRHHWAALVEHEAMPTLGLASFTLIGLTVMVYTLILRRLNIYT